MSFPALSKVWPSRFVLPLILPLAVLVLWQLAATHQWLPVQILPPPALVASTLAELIRDGEIANNLQISLWRIASGFLIGGVAGLIFGAMIGLSRTLDAYFGPFFKALAQIPSLGWIPILILVFGLAEIVKVLIISKACFVPILLATSEAIRGIPRQYVEVGQVLRLRRKTLLLRLILPASLPTMFTGFRLALGHAWTSLIVVEMLAATEGVGYMMVWGRTLFQLDIVIAGMIVIGVIGLSMDAVLKRIERRLSRWRPAQEPHA